MRPTDSLLVTIIIVAAVTLAVVATVRQVNLVLDRRAFRRRNHAHPQEWDR